MFVFQVLFLFMIGSMTGWIIELLFRRFFSAKRWINPGFLVGPCLPLYGFGVAGMYLLSMLGDILPIENEVVRILVTILMLGVAMTVIEYFAGLIFIKGMHIKLWDYSDRWGNIQGIICPLFSFFWLAVAAIYYLFINQYFVIAAKWIANLDHAYALFFVGLFYGILFVDLAYSFNLSKKISKLAKESKIVIQYERLKQSILEQVNELKERSHFILAFKSSVSLVDSVKRYVTNKVGLSKKEKKKLAEQEMQTNEEQGN